MKDLLIEKDILLGYDVDNTPIKYNSKVKLIGTDFNITGHFEYSHEDLCFKIIWNDGTSRSLDKRFLSTSLKVIS